MQLTQGRSQLVVDFFFDQKSLAADFDASQFANDHSFAFDYNITRRGQIPKSAGDPYHYKNSTELEDFTFDVQKEQSYETRVYKEHELLNRPAPNYDIPRPLSSTVCGISLIIPPGWKGYVSEEKEKNWCSFVIDQEHTGNSFDRFILSSTTTTELAQLLEKSSKQLISNKSFSTGNIEGMHMSYSSDKPNISTELSYFSKGKRNFYVFYYLRKQNKEVESVYTGIIESIKFTED